MITSQRTQVVFSNEKRQHALPPEAAKSKPFSALCAGNGVAPRINVWSNVQLVIESFWAEMPATGFYTSVHDDIGKQAFFGIKPVDTANDDGGKGVYPRFGALGLSADPPRKP